MQCFVMVTTSMVWVTTTVEKLWISRNFVAVSGFKHAMSVKGAVKYLLTNLISCAYDVTHGNALTNT